MRNPRPRSAGFVVLDTRSGEVLSPLFPGRHRARCAILRYYSAEGVAIHNGVAQVTPAEAAARGLRLLGIHQVKLYPGETFDPTERR